MTTDPQHPTSTESQPPDSGTPKTSSAPLVADSNSAIPDPQESQTSAGADQSGSQVPSAPPVAASAPDESDASTAQLSADDVLQTMSVVVTGGVSSSDESVASRIREKMSAAMNEHAEAAEQSSAPRRESGGSGRSVEIPRPDALDPSLEAEIQAIMVGPGSAPPDPVDVTSETGESSKETGVVQGSKVKGIVQQIHGDDVFLDAGLRTNVVVSLKQFAENKQPTVGAELEVVIDALDADGLIRGRIPRSRHKPGGNWDALAVGQIVDCMVGSVNKGGLQVTVSGLRGFLPASQIELGFAGNLDAYVGQKLTVQVTEVNPKKRNLVVSRRALLQAERAEGEGEFWTAAEVGQEYSGTVKTIKDYGAFVNIGAVDGFLHIGEISWSRINHPNEVLQEGQTVDVKVLKLDPEKKRISLGMKQLAQNPWTSASEKYSTGRVVPGKVTRTTDFGAFVELEPGLEGMVHISELAWRRVGSVTEILTVGETREFQVQEVDTKRKRVSLSLKALEKRPEPVRQERTDAPEAAATPAEPRKPRNPNLRGGTDRTASGGGLFGNPSDFNS